MLQKFLKLFAGTSCPVDSLADNSNDPKKQEAASLAELEPRIMFSAAPVADLVEPDLVSNDFLNELGYDIEQAFFESQELAQMAVEDIQFLEEQLAAELTGDNGKTGPLELVIIDTSVSDYETLIGDLFQQSDRNLEVFLLDSKQDGISQISEIISEHEAVGSIHLVSHGQNGSIQLGSTLLSADNFNAYSSSLQSWNNGELSNVDLLIYGCNLAGGAEGQNLLELINTETGFDVAASDDLTGAERLGGDWDLEYHVGTITTGSAFSLNVVANWNHVLDLIPAGGETLVNESTTGNQDTTPNGGGNVAMDANGNYAVVWEDNRSGDVDTYLKIYNADGSVRVSEFVVHSTAANQDWSNVAMTDDGNVIVTWSDLRSGDFEVYMRIFSVDGVALTGETLVSTLAGDQDASSVETAADGSFVVAFHNSTDGDIYFQRYDANGVAQGVNTRVNTTIANLQRHPDVAVADNGSFVVTWGSNLADGSGYAIHGQRFDAAGIAQGGEFQINTTTANDQTRATVDSDANGNFVVTWMSHLQDGSSYGVFAQRFADDGTALGSEFQVNTYTNLEQGSPNVAMNKNGDFIITWHSNGQDGSGFGVYAQQYDRSGSVIGSEFKVSTSSTNTQEMPTVAYSDEQAVVVWSGEGTQAGQVDSSGVFTQRLTVAYSHTLTVDTSSDVVDGTTTSIDALLTDVGADGFISLREAIEAANNTVGADTINFSIAGAGVHTISLDTALPYITDELTLDATSQAGGSFTTPLIELVKSGSFSGPETAAINIRASNSTVSGFIIGGWADEGIEVDGSTGFGDNNTIEWNWVGFDSTGAAAGVGDDGILITEAADNNVIRNNVVASSGGDGIHVRNSSTNNWIWGNIVGLATDGMTVRANSNNGIHLSGSTTYNTIGTDGDGTNDVLERNVVSGNLDYGIYLTDVGTRYNVVAGNYIGLAGDGLTARGNSAGVGIAGGASFNTIGGDWNAGEGNVIAGNSSSRAGIYITGDTSDNNTIQGNRIGTDASGTVAIGNFHGIWNADADNTVIGGDSAAGLGNLVSGNNVHGVYISGSSTNVVAQGNLIGTDASGTSIVAMGNGFDGIRLEGGASGNTIGGDRALNLGNVIAGNLDHGINVNSADSNVIIGNWIGTNSLGHDLGNIGTGVYFDFASSSNLVGSIAAGFGNTIAFNTNGIATSATATGSSNQFRGNEIRDNTGLGIDLLSDGVTANDPGDTDGVAPALANQLQNFPVIYDVHISGGNVTITGEAAAGAIVDFYQVINDGDTHGEASIHIGFGTVSASAANGKIDSAMRQFSFTFAAGGLTSVDEITALATDPTAGTSEFAANVVVNEAPTDIVFDSEFDSETQVNTYTTLDQRDSAIAAFADGGYIVVWSSDGQDGDGYGIYAQRFNADGTLNGSEFLVTTETVDSEQLPSVTTFADGGFAIAWQDIQTSVRGWVEARVFNADGTPATSEFSVSPGIDGNNEGYRPSILALDNSNFAVVWSNETAATTYSMEGRIYDRTGTQVGSQFTLGALGVPGALFTADSELTLLNDGGFAAVWRTYDGANFGTSFAIMNSDGSVRSGEIVIATGDNHGDIAGLSNGNVVVTYQSGNSLRATIYDSSGAVVVPEFNVNTTVSTGIYEPTVIRSDDGFVIAWESSDGDGSGTAILAQRFDANGVMVDGEIVVNETTSGNQYHPELIETSSGEVRVAWASENIDASGLSVVTRAIATGDASVDENSTNGTFVVDVLGVLDLDSTDTHTFDLTDNAGGRFIIDTNTGVVTVNNGSLLNFETDPTHVITVEATDSAGNTYTEDLTINVNDINESPTVGSGSLTAVTEDTINPPGDTIDNLFSGSFSDPDTGSSMSGILVTHNPENASEGIWQYSTDGTNWHDVGTIAYPASLALSSSTMVRFVPSSNFNGTPTGLSLRALDNTYSGGFTSGASKVTFDASSPGNGSPISSSLVSLNTSITSVNDDPVLDLDGDNNSGGADPNFITSFTENGGPVAVADTDAVLFDVDDTNLGSITVTLLNPLNGTMEQLTADTSGTSITAVYDSSTGILSLSGSDTVANYLQVLKTVTYDNVSEDPDTSVRLIEFIVNDGMDDSSPAYTVVVMSAINDAPVIATNTGASVDENDSVIITTSMLNEADVDDDGAELTYNVTGGLAHGHIELSTNPTVPITSFTQAQVDAGIVRYVHDGSENFSDHFDFELADGGEDGALPDSGTFNIAINPVNDNAPNAGIVFTAYISEESANGTAVGTVTATDLDLPGDTLAYSITAGDPLNGFAIDSNGNITISDASVLDLNFDDGTDLIATLTITVSDGTFSDTVDVTIRVTDLNEEPQGTDKTVTAIEDVDYVFQELDFGFSDPEDGHNFAAVQISSLPGSGTLYLDSNLDGVVDIGETITVNQIVSVADINAGRLKFRAATGDFGVGYASFNFQVQDDGGLPGIDMDQTANTITIDVTEAFRIEGNIFEDVDGDSNLADGVGVASVDVHLYQDTDGVVGISAGDAFIASTITDGSGAYTFTGLLDGTYFVVVDSSTITPSLAFSGSPWAEQTYGVAGAVVADGSGGTTSLTTAGSAFGGKQGDVSDNASSLVTAEHVTIVASTAGNDIANVDSGFSFNVVTNTEDSGQGSLRQFVDNANVISGNNSMRFVPVVSVNATGGSGDWWSVTLSSNLASLTDAGTTIDGTAYSFNDGTTVVDTNVGTVNTSRTVGVDGLTLDAVARQELEINFSGNSEGIVIDADNVTVQNIGLFGAVRLAGSTGAQIHVTENVFSIGEATITGNVLGARADGSDPGVLRGSTGMLVNGASTITNNYFAYLNQSGLRFNGLPFGNSDGSIFENNEVHSVAYTHTAGDAITVDSAGNTVRGNYIHDLQLAAGIHPYNGKGIELWYNANNNLIDNNTIISAITAGIGIGDNASDNTISKNIITGTTGVGGVGGSGVLVSSAGTGEPTRNTITQNEIYNNAGLGIDIDESGGFTTAYGNGVTVNDGILSAAGVNELMDYPVVTIANLAGNSLTLSGYIGTTPNQSTFAGARVEFYRADSDPSGHGEGRTYLGFLVADANGNFSGTLTVSGLTDADEITATATNVNGSTSEFGLSKGVNVAPIDINPDNFNVDENTNTSLGFSFGAVTVTDADSIDPTEIVNWSIVPGVGDASLFSIGGLNNDELILNDGVLDFETKSIYTVTVRATDSGGLTYDEQIMVAVDDVNELPTLSLANVTSNLVENSDTSVRIKVADIIISDDALGTNALSLSGTDANSFEIVGSELYLKSGIALDHEFKSTFEVTVEVDDSSVGVDPDHSIQYQLDITDSNDRPTLDVNQTITVNEGSTVVIDNTLLSTSDEDVSDGPNSLVYTMTQAPVYGVLLVNDHPAISFTQDDIDNGRVSYRHDGSETTFDQINLQVTDGSSPPLVTTMNIVIDPVNDLPVAQDHVHAINEDTVLTGDTSIAAVDSEGDVLTYQLVSGPSNADTFSLMPDGSFTYAPQENYFGTDSFTYQINDGTGVSNVAQVVINIANVNDVPQGQTDFYVASMFEDLQIIGGLLSNDHDLDGDPLEAVLISGPTQGSILLSRDGSFIYTPKPGFVGADSFVYMPTDGVVSGTPTTVTIIVEGASNQISTGDDENDPINVDNNDGSENEGSGNTIEEVINDILDRIDAKLNDGSTVESDDMDDSQQEDNRKSKVAALQKLLAGGLESQASNSDSSEPNEAGFLLPAGDINLRTDALKVFKYFVNGSGLEISSSSDIEEFDRIRSDLPTVLFNRDVLWQELDTLGSELDGHNKFNIEIDASVTIAVATVASTVGYVLWSLRGGVLMASLLSSLPVWKIVDPLPILETSSLEGQEDSDESLESLFKHH